ncbi:GntR family transcriptional regulator [uncultured Sulfitobacter sp.]|uniref:GntR family transcriptional regulator n=1 Tax=uncultured Sulfitobacter sp. TaxID=191468 RepID=UPI00260F5ACA|nr:GntR family transcriptional regulator [uncultured Sulfitobacter sp.]
MTLGSLKHHEYNLGPILPNLAEGPQALSLAEQIATQLAESIINDEYAPGARIHEVAVSKEFQVSRGPVREALRILENAGLVTIQPRRGAIVSNLTVEEVDDTFEIRAVLVGLAARRLARNIASTDLAQIEERIARLQDLTTQADQDAARYVGISQELSFLLCAGTGSERLTSIVYSLFHQTIRYTRIGLSTPERRKTSAKTWAKLLANIQAGAEDEAEKTARELVGHSRAMAIETLRKEQRAD